MGLRMPCVADPVEPLGLVATLADAELSGVVMGDVNKEGGVYDSSGSEVSLPTAKEDSNKSIEGDLVMSMDGEDVCSSTS